MRDFAAKQSSVYCHFNDVLLVEIKVKKKRNLHRFVKKKHNKNC